MDKGAEKEVQTDEAFALWAGLARCRDAISRVRQNELREIGISPTQAGILYMVKNSTSPMTPAQISRGLFRQPNTVLLLLRRMEERGLVTQTKDLERKNLVRLRLTEKGEKVYHQSRLTRDSIREIMSCLSRRERSNLQAYLKKLQTEAIGIIRLSGKRLLA